MDPRDASASKNLLAGPGWVPQSRLSQLAADQGTKRVGEEDGLDDLQGQLVVEEHHDENQVDRDADVSCACVPELELYSHLVFISIYYYGRVF